MNSSETEHCRKKANWCVMGKMVSKRPRSVYRVLIRPGDDLVERLGSIKLRAAGRWGWWRWKSKWHKWETGQGVAATRDEAMVAVLQGWE